MTRTYSVEQQAYMLAKAQYDTIFAEYQQRVRTEVPRLAEDTTDAEFEANCERAEVIATETGLDAARAVCAAAEKALFDWAHATVKVLPQYREHAAIITNMFAKVYGKRRDELIDMALKLSA